MPFTRAMSLNLHKQEHAVDMDHMCKVTIARDSSKMPVGSIVRILIKDATEEVLECKLDAHV